MRQHTAIAFTTLFLSSQALASGGFEPNKQACVNVSKEISRVSTEMDITKSNIQKSWLKRQLNALNTKRSVCSAKGFELKAPKVASQVAKV